MSSKVGSVKVSSSSKRKNYTVASDIPYFYYTNAPGPNEIVCGVNCACSRGKKYATENTIPGYTHIKFLGKGGYGAVHLYRCNETRGPVAIKEISYSVEGSKDIYHEVASEYEIVMNIKHPNITRYFDFFVIENRYKCYIVMEYAKRGTLRQLLNEQVEKNVYFYQTTVLRMIYDVIKGVQALNSNHVVHCDLKPENILVADDGKLKICDFGTAHLVSNLNSRTASTLCYAAPERLDGIRPDEKTEIWAIGVIFYELCTLDHPFSPIGNNMDLMAKIKAGLFKSINCRLSGYSYDMQGLSELMLQKHREYRHNLSDLLKHKLLKTIQSESRY